MARTTSKTPAATPVVEAPYGKPSARSTKDQEAYTAFQVQNRANGLRALRESKGLGRVACATLLGIHHLAWWRLENDSTTAPNGVDVEKARKALAALPDKASKAPGKGATVKAPGKGATVKAPGKGAKGKATVKSEDLI
jgi:hypothetical protein